MEDIWPLFLEECLEYEPRTNLFENAGFVYKYFLDGSARRGSWHGHHVHASIPGEGSQTLHWDSPESDPVGDIKEAIIKFEGVTATPEFINFLRNGTPIPPLGVSATPYEPIKFEWESRTPLTDALRDGTITPAPLPKFDFGDWPRYSASI